MPCRGSRLEEKEAGFEAETGIAVAYIFVVTADSDSEPPDAAYVALFEAIVLHRD